MKRPEIDEVAVGAAVLAGTLGFAAAAGGFGAVAWNVGALVAIWAALLALLFLRTRRPGSWSIALLGSVVLLLGWTALSAVWSQSRAASFLDSERVLLYVAIVCAAVLLSSALTPRAAAAAVALAAVVVCCWSIVIRLPDLSSANANQPPVGYDNSLGLLAAMGVLLVLGLARAWTPAWLLGLAPFAFVLAFARSTGSWAALVGGAVIFVLLASRLRGAIVLGGAALVVAGFALGAWQSASSLGRGAYWHAAAQEIAARPLLGTGGGTYREWFVRVRDVAVQTHQAHSLYLEQLGELGPVGLVLTLAIVLVPLAAAWQIRRRPLVPALAGAVAAYALGAGVDFHWELPVVTAPVLLLGAALASAADGRSPVAWGRLRPAAAMGAAAVAALAALALAGSAPQAAAERALSRGQFAAAARDARTATRWKPWSPDPWLQLGRARLELGETSAARAAFRRAIRADGRDWRTWLALADASTGAPRRRALARAAQLNPLYFGTSG